MFDCFTFGAQPQKHFHQPDEAAASPTDISCIPTQPAPTSYPFPEASAGPAMNDLLDKLGGQTLVPDDNEGSQPSMWNDTLSGPAFENAVEEGFQFTYISTRRGLTTFKASPSSGPAYSAPTSSSHSSPPPCKRLQRQLNTQLQTCTNHVKDITDLVEDMISTNTQCTLYPAPTTPLPIIEAPSPPQILALDPDVSTAITPSTPPQILEADSDEGFSELDELGALELLIQQQEQAQDHDEATSLRRASGPGGIRKFGGVKYPFAGSGFKSFYGDKGDGSSNLAAREKGKVRSMPRMRRRKEDKGSNGKGKGKESMC